MSQRPGPSSISLKVITLNCWGLYSPLSKFRHERMIAIGEKLSKGEFDVILLQEVWVRSDYEMLCDYILPAMNYTHYFHSGVIGSGVCLFSKYPILDTFQHTFSVCGFAHRIMHGDWYAGKAVGMAVLDCQGFRVNVYVTHTHAGYPGHDYAIHKTVQSYELGQFIKLTNQGCDVAILGGDLNAQWQDNTLQLSLSLASLKDAWNTQRAEHVEADGMTSSIPGSPFTNNQDRKNTSVGARIDYLLYRDNHGFDMTCDKCYTTMGQVPDKPYFYSDHMGVAADFTIRRNITSMGAESSPKLAQCLSIADETLETGLKQAAFDRKFYFLVFFLYLLIHCSCDTILPVPFFLNWIVTFIKVFALFGCGFCVWMGIVGNKQEVSSFTSARKDMKILRKHLQSSASF